MDIIPFNAAVIGVTVFCLLALITLIARDALDTRRQRKAQRVARESYARRAANAESMPVRVQRAA